MVHGASEGQPSAKKGTRLHYPDDERWEPNLKRCAAAQNIMWHQILDLVKGAPQQEGAEQMPSTYYIRGDFKQVLLGQSCYNHN